MDILTSIETVMDSDLLHYGRPGMKWGVRNGPPYPLHPDQLSSAEKKARRSVFISGSSKTQFEDSGYYRKELPKAIQNKIDDYIKDHAHIIVGDAPGIDRQVQDYLNEKGYDAVEIYGPGKQVRYAANEKWKTNPVDAPEFEEMSPEWLRKKDIAMTNDATEGLAIVLDDGAQATRNNVARLREQGKQAEVFILGKDGEDDFEAETGSYETRSQATDRERIKKAWKTHGLVDEILNSLNEEDKYRVLVGSNSYLEKEQGKYVIKRSIIKSKGKPVSFADLLADGDRLVIEMATKPGEEYRGKGYATKALKTALNWYEKNKYDLPYTEIVGGILADNYGSIKVAEKLGFERGKVSEDGKWVDYVKKTKKNTLSHSDFLSAVELVLPDDALQYGILGQKWGIRKWQNKDGTLTPAGRERWINSLKQEAYAASKKWEEYQAVRKQVINMHYEGKFDNELETKMLRLKEEANEAGAIWGSLRKRIESYLENGPDVSTSEPVEGAPHKVLISVSDEKKYQHFLDLGYEEKGRNDTWIYMVNHKKNIKHSDNQNDVFAAIETVMDSDIEHSGRRGQKWGERNGPPYPLQPDQLSARERMLDSSGKKNIAATGERKKWQSSDTLSELASIPYNGLVGGKLTHLGRKHLDKMLSSKELQDFAERNSKSKAYSLKKAGVRKSEQGGSVIGKDTTMQRIADSSDAITDKRKYVSVTSNDQKHYKSIYDKGFLAVQNRDDASAFKYKGKKELRVADASDVMNYIVNSYGHRKEKKFYSDVKKIEPYRDAFKELYRTGLGSAADLAVANYYDYASFELKRFVKNNLWDGASETGKQTYAKNKQKEILNHYKELGYDAIADVEDVLSGYEYPIILINPSESVRLSGKQKLSHSELYLAHYRRGGEKKGVRNYQYYDGSLTPLGRIHYGVGPPREAKAEDPERATLSKSGIHKQNAQTDVIVSGTKFVRQASAKDDQYHDRKYMSVTKKDVDHWRGEGEQEAEYTYEAKRNLKVANAQAVVDYIVQDMMGYGQSEEGKKLSSLYEKYRGDTWDHFFEKRSNKKERARMWDVVTKQRSRYGREGATESHRQILDHFSRLGYDAMVDINQSWQGMEYPIIVIDPDDSTKLVTKLVRRS